MLGRVNCCDISKVTRFIYFTRIIQLMGKRMHGDMDPHKDPPEAWWHEHFEPAFFNMRYIIIIPVVVAFIGAFIMFIIGAIEAWNSIERFIDHDYQYSQLGLILGIDAFLLGLVLLSGILFLIAGINLTKATDLYFIYFEGSIGNLKEGSPVKFQVRSPPTSPSTVLSSVSKSFSDRMRP